MNIPTDKLKPISLEEMSAIRLMDRIDTKYVAPFAMLPALLDEMSELFRIQEIDGRRIANYTTQYFDTPDYDFFLMHHNGKLNRQKIRIRSYADSKLSFLEVKNKNNKGRTRKKRIEVDKSHVESLTELPQSEQFLQQFAIFPPNWLTPALENTFKRMTFVNNKATERITVDFELMFNNRIHNSQADFSPFIVLELKQDGWQRSDFSRILQDMRIKRSSFSKYCIGTVATNPQIKYNRFKSKIIRINKRIDLAI